jgi:hypothetical protein
MSCAGPRSSFTSPNSLSDKDSIAISCAANLDDFDHNPRYSSDTNRLEVIFDGYLTRKCGGA